MSGAHGTVRTGRASLLDAVLAAAASHDRECLRAQAALREAFSDRSLARQLDIGTLLDEHRRALTGLCAALGPAARSRVDELAPFATQLTDTAAIAALDDQGLDLFLRPIFEEAGLADRFVLDPVARTEAPVLAITKPAIELVPVTLDAETLFDHLLTHRETISYGSAYRAMLGPWIGPWRSLVHVPMVLQVARGTGMRVSGDVDLRLDSLIVNKKTRRPGGRHFREHPGVAEEAWLERFGRWSACEHAAAEIGVGRPAARPAEPPSAPATDERHAPIAAPAVEDVAAVHDPPPAAAPIAPPGPATVPETREEVHEARTSAPPVAPPDPDAAVEAEDPGLPLVVDEPPTEAAAPPGPPLAPTLEPAGVSARPMPAPGVRRPRPSLAVAGRNLLRVAVACIAAIVLGSLVGSVVASQAVPPRGPESEAQAGSPLALNDTFGALPLGSDPGWDTSGPGGPAGSMRVDPLPTSVDRSLRVQGGAADQPFSACRAIPRVRGPLLIEARILVDGFGAGDIAIASIRSDSDDVAGLRIGPEGRILGPGDAGVRGGAAAIARGAWYDISFQLDTASRTSHLVVSRSNPPELITAQDGGWKRPLDGGVDRVCFTPPGAAQSVYINQLRVTAP